jgi:hypothetical protein
VAEPVLKKTPDVCKRIEEILHYETAGDPISGLKWTHRTMEKISDQLKSVGICVSPNTVGKLLKEMKYSLRVNHKRLVSGIKDTKQKRINRDKQFRHIAGVRKQFEKKGFPVISIDTKKKENVGNFRNEGTTYQKEPIRTNDHDFASDATGKAIPYGIFDDVANRGSVFIGTSRDTPAFSVDCIEKWWKYEGQKRYPHADTILVLADSGGSNRPNSNVWKKKMHDQLCCKYGIKVRVCHYAPGSSKWNPIEHRLFCEIQKNWKGIPLKDYETILKYIRTTKTKTGLKTRSYLVNKEYEIGEKVSAEEMVGITIKPGKVFPE